jgi:hypothetical protein
MAENKNEEQLLLETRKVKADRPVITESARSTSKETTFNPYVEELERLNRYK